MYMYFNKEFQVPVKILFVLLFNIDNLNMNVHFKFSTQETIYRSQNRHKQKSTQRVDTDRVFDLEN